MSELPRRRSLVPVLIVAVLTALAVLVPTRPASAQSASADVVDTAVAAGSFTTLARALQATGLVDTLKGPGPFTVFAPTDAAFAKLPAGTLDRLLANPDQLRAVLTYHVVPGRVTASQVVGLSSANSVQGEPIRIAVSGGTVTLNGTARVTQADIAASNGVIHVIDTVILPPSLAPRPTQLPNTGEADSALPIAALLGGLVAVGAGLALRRRRSGDARI